MSVMVYGKLKLFCRQTIYRMFFSVILMNKKYVKKNELSRQDTPLVPDSANSIII